MNIRTVEVRVDESKLAPPRIGGDPQYTCENDWTLVIQEHEEDHTRFILWFKRPLEGEILFGSKVIAEVNSNEEMIRLVLDKELTVTRVTDSLEFRLKT